MLIQCSRCHAVFSLQDGVAPAGARFKVECGRCRAVFEAIAAPRSAPQGAPQEVAPGEPQGGAVVAGAEGDILDPGDAEEWTPESAEAVVRPPGLALAPEVAPEAPAAVPGAPEAFPEAPAAVLGAPAAVPEAPAVRALARARRFAARHRWAVLLGALALALTAFIAVRERGHASTVEEMLRRGRELLLRDDRRSLEEATKLFTDAVRVAPGQAVPEAERAFALLLQAASAKDLARRVAPPEREKQERDAARLLQQGSAAARQALSDDKEEPLAMRAAALGAAVEGKADEAAVQAAQAEGAAPGDPWVLYVKGAAAAAAQKQDLAVQALSAARQAEPRLLRVDVDLAGIALDGGDAQGARALLVKVLKENPQHDRARRMLSLVGP